MKPFPLMAALLALAVSGGSLPYGIPSLLGRSPDPDRDGP